MGKPRTPTKVLEMRGAFVKHPERRSVREHEPPVEVPLAPAPACLNEAEQARYEQIRGWCPWLADSDGPLVERTAKLWARLRDGTDKHGDEKQFITNLGKLGMTPVDRSKVSLMRQAPESAVEKYAT